MENHHFPSQRKLKKLGMGQRNFLEWQKRKGKSFFPQKYINLLNDREKTTPNKQICFSGGTSKQKDYFDPVSQMKKSKGPKVLECIRIFHVLVAERKIHYNFASLVNLVTAYFTL